MTERCTAQALTASGVPPSGDHEDREAVSQQVAQQPQLEDYGRRRVDPRRRPPAHRRVSTCCVLQAFRILTRLACVPLHIAEFSGLPALYLNSKQA